VLLFSNLREYWTNTRELPLVVRMLCRAGMLVAPFFLVMLILPTEWAVDGRQMSSAELWRSGQAIAVALPLLLYGTSAWGLAARQAWSRRVLVAAPPLSCLAMILSPATRVDVAVPDVLEATGLAVVIYIGLFHVKAVKMFFAGR